MFVYYLSSVFEGYGTAAGTTNGQGGKQQGEYSNMDEPLL